MDALAHRIQIALHQLKQNMESVRLNSAESSNITRPQMFMLYTIRKIGKCKLTQLAEQMEVKPSAITVMIDRLEKAGCVKRTHDTEDRRSILVEVTPSGNEMLEQTIREKNGILKGYLQRLQPQEIEMLAELLERLASPAETMADK